VTEYGKSIKKKLIDMDKPSAWLIDEIKSETQLYCDSAYLSKIINGERKAPKITAAINKILKL